MLVTNLEFQEDFCKIQSEVFSILEKYNNPPQICLQGKTPDFEDLYEGTGTAKESEQLYCNLHNSLLGSEIEKVIKRFSGVRTRIMKLNPKQCYSVHRDYSKRIHIPIKTNDQSWMVWPYEKYFTRLSTEKIYLTDTTKYHSFFNGGVEERIHLVLCVY